MNGTDFPALARLIQNRTGIDCFFRAHQWNARLCGRGRACIFRAGPAICQKASGRVIPQSVSILGLTPWILLRRGTAAILKAKLEEWGYSILSCWAMGSGLEELALAGDAQVNLVISATALDAAKSCTGAFIPPMWRAFRCVRASMR